MDYNCHITFFNNDRTLSLINTYHRQSCQWDFTSGCVICCIPLQTLALYVINNPYLNAELHAVLLNQQLSRPSLLLRDFFFILLNILNSVSYINIKNESFNAISFSQQADNKL